MTPPERYPLRLPIRLTTDQEGSIVGIERLAPRTVRPDNPPVLRVWRSDAVLDDALLQECDTVELRVPVERVELVFNALAAFARRQSPTAHFREFRTWADFRDAVASHQLSQGVFQ